MERDSCDLKKINDIFLLKQNDSSKEEEKVAYDLD